ncbi:MAG: ParB/RepB/Spo0J family partition protein [Candidatus Jorgensenbacteria bacterium]
MSDTALAKAKTRREMGYLFLRTKRIRPFKGQPRIHFDEVALGELKASIKEVGLRRPVEVMPIEGDPEHDYELIDGERRWICHVRMGREEIKAIIGDPEDEDEQFVHSVVSNMAHQPHTSLEVAHAIDRILKGRLVAGIPRTRQVERVANMFARSIPWIYQHLGLLKLHPEVQILMGPTNNGEKRLVFSVAIFLSSLSPELQLKIARHIVEKGMRLNQARVYARRVAEEAGESAGKGRVRKPSDDYRNLSSFLRRLGESTDAILDMPAGNFDRMFENRSPQDRDAMVGQIRECLSGLGQFLEYLERLNV